jgi:hypothetical protein
MPWLVPGIFFCSHEKNRRDKPGDDDLKSGDAFR